MKKYLAILALFVFASTAFGMWGRVIAPAQHYGELFLDGSAVTVPLDDQNQWVMVDGWTIDHCDDDRMGCEVGQRDTYTAVADLGGSPNLVRVTSSSAHGLGSANEYISMTGGAYNGIYKIIAISDSTHFDIESAFSGTDTGTWIHGGHFVATALPGLYTYMWTISFTGATGKTFEMAMLVDGVIQSETVIRRLTAASDVGVMITTGILLVDGAPHDHIQLAVRCITNPAVDMTIVESNVSIFKLR